MFLELEKSRQTNPPLEQLNRQVSTTPTSSRKLFHQQSAKANKSVRRRGEGGSIKKSDIGMPFNFIHVQTVGFNANSGFDINVNKEEENIYMDLCETVSSSLFIAQ